MKQALQNNTEKRPWSLQMKQRVWEGLFLFALTSAIFLFLSLMSYSPRDPGWSNTGLDDSVANVGGRIGAFAADFLLSFLGIMAYVLIPLCIYLTCLGIQNRKKTEFELHAGVFKLLGSFFVITSGCGLAALLVHLKHSGMQWPFLSGGILGNILAKELHPILNRAGTTLLLTAAFLSGVTLLTGLSWFNCVEALVQSSWQHFKKMISFRLPLPANTDNTQKITAPLMPVEEPVKKSVPLVVKTDRLPWAEPDVSPRLKAESSKKNKTSSVHAMIPPLALLNSSPVKIDKAFSHHSLEELSLYIEQRLMDFGVAVKVMAVYPGPIVTRFELELAPGIKVSKISGLSKDIARSLSMTSVRVVDIIPGKSVIGLEVPNENREVVFLRELLESSRFTQSPSPLSLALGKDISGYPIIVDLAKMPHLLVAGTTGSGKSVSLNAMLLSLLFKSTPEQLRFILIDPKILELSIYEGIPHLLTSVITDMKDASNALRWCVAEMDRRYRLMTTLGVRNLASCNLKITEAIQQGAPLKMPAEFLSEKSTQMTLTPLPMIVVVIDELADMMMVVGKKVEDLVTRIAQKARAAGIHLILATQRPSVDVITGLIKANIPTRIAFQVSSRVDSRTILDQQGAEHLLGSGDMLYLPPGIGLPVRVHGAYVADDEVHRVVAAWKELGKPAYLDDITIENDDRFS